MKVNGGLEWSAGLWGGADQVDFMGAFMSKVFYSLAGGDFAQDWSNTGLITTSVTGTDPAATGWENVPSIVGYIGDTFPSTSPTNLDASAQTGANLGQFNVFANQTSYGFSSGGVAEFQNGNPTIAIQGSGTADNPSIVLYLDSSGRQGLHVDFDLRHLDTDITNQQFALMYRVGDSGAWTNLPGAYSANLFPTLASPDVHVSLDLPSFLNNQAQVELRFATVNAPSSDSWIGIDNIHVTSSPASADTTPPSLIGSNPAEHALVTPASNLVLTFDETVKAGAGSFTIVGDLGDTHVISAADTSQVTFSGNVVTINPSADLNVSEGYHLSVGSTAVTDAAGNAYAGTSAPIDFATYNPTPHIYDIQGAGHTSAYNGLSVTTTGVVTAIDTTGSKGFWIQDPTGDGNDATSDAVFVFTSTAPTVAVGQLVSVQGVVNEFQGSDPNNLTITEINSPTVTLLDHDVHTIAPTIIGEGGRLPPTEVIEDDHFGTFDPSQDAADFYESLEGMLVTVVDAQAVDSTLHNADGSLGNSTWIVANEGADATGMNGRGGISITAGDLNPEKVQIFYDSGVAPASAQPNALAGDHLGDVTGVLSYFGGNYELIPTAVGSQGTGATATLPRETTTLAGDADHVTIGAYNCENLDPTDPQAKFDQLGVDIAQNLHAPDIVGLEEIQDADGAGNGTNYSGAVTAQKLIDAIVAAGGPHYVYVEVAPTANNTTGGESNGNIRQGFLYNPDRVSLVAGSVHQIVDGDLSNGDAYNNSRKPLVADFTFNGQKITVVDVHNYSRGGSEETFGQDQPAAISGDDRRTDQTLWVKKAVEATVAADPNANVVVMGDFNGFQFETAQTQLESGGALSNLTRLLPVDEQYSYSFEGNSQEIDHQFVSPNLQSGAAFDIVHLNSLQPSNERPTDHDPIVSRLFVNAAPVANTDAAAVSENQTVTIDVLANDIDANAGDTRTLIGITGATAAGHATIVNGKVVYVADGDAADALRQPQTLLDTLTYQVQDSHGAISNGTINVTVRGIADAPARTGTAGADTMAGSNPLDDTLNGAGGNDKLSGLGGTDTLNGGAGDDTLSGGLGVDRFIFTGAFGKDVVTDFESKDVIQLDHSAFADFAAVQTHAAQVGTSVVITLDAADTITLQNTTLGALNAGEFVFV